MEIKRDPSEREGHLHTNGQNPVLGLFSYAQSTAKTFHQRIQILNRIRTYT